MEISLPKAVRKATAYNPHMLLVYSSPKVGKTTITAQLENHLIVELEPGGTDFVDANPIKANSPKEFEAICNQIIAEGCPYDYVIFDTITTLDQWSEIVGTMEYMEKAQGKRFNRDEKGLKIKPNDQRFETVHSLANGAGYAFSREKMIEWYNLMSKTAKHVILIAHIKDKFIESKSGDTVESSDINLTGKVKFYYCSRVDAVAHFLRKGNKGYLNFDNENSIICGGRCKHLDGQILVSEQQPDKSVKTFWENIYLKE